MATRSLPLSVLTSPQIKTLPSFAGDCRLIDLLSSCGAQGQLLQFNLDGTAQLLPSLANCVAIVTQHGLAAAGDFTVRQGQRAAAEEASRPRSAGGAPRVDASSATDL